MTTEAAVPWQILLFRKSLKKKIKWRILEDLLPPLDASSRCLDLGCAKGTLSYLLRGRGGSWVSADLDQENLAATRRLTGGGVCRVDYRSFPFPDGAFDVVVSLDFLEHVADDRRCLDEIARVLRPGGVLILSTPATGGFRLAYWLRDRAGLSLEDYGHVREGYRRGELLPALRGRGIGVDHFSTYSRFFTEALELILNVVYVRGSRRRSPGGARDGAIVPGSAEEVRRMRKKLRLYALVYPFFRLVSSLDALLFFTDGYALMIRGKKAPGNTREQAAVSS